MKSLARRAAYRALAGSGVLAYQRYRKVHRGAGWATILVYHTLADRHDGITIRPRLFREILAMLKRDYHVISTSELVTRLRQGGPFTGREVVITFDDGYLDNYEIAAPALAELGLPATFYLTAGYVGTTRQFPWDAAAGHTTRMMSWEQAREMHAMGFEIGHHTWSHPNLGTEPIASAPRELGDSKAKLEDELGAPVVHFAYPFGGKQNIRPEWIDAAREAGLETTFSCHGGLVRTGVDPYHIPRLGAHQRTLTDLRIELDDAW